MDNSYATHNRLLDALHSIERREIDGKCTSQLLDLQSFTLTCIQPADNIHELTFVFTSLVLFSATQGTYIHHAPCFILKCFTDIAVDGPLFDLFSVTSILISIQDGL